MLTVTMALPNPAGKDRRPTSAPTDDQLNGEWVEFRNPAATSVSLDGISIRHYSFQNCVKTGERLLTTFRHTLGAGRSIRLHTGHGAAWDEGTVRHLYLNRGNYVWNNDCGDSVVLRDPDEGVIDWASYEAHPPEGVVLYRIPNSNRLAAVSATATGTQGWR